MLRYLFRFVVVVVLFSIRDWKQQILTIRRLFVLSTKDLSNKHVFHDDVVLYVDKRDHAVSFLFRSGDTWIEAVDHIQNPRVVSGPKR